MDVEVSAVVVSCVEVRLVEVVVNDDVKLVVVTACNSVLVDMDVVVTVQT